MATVNIPTPLRKFTNNAAKVTVNAGKVSDAVIELSTSYPSLQRYLVDSEGKITSFVNIFVGNDDIRNLQGEHTEIDLQSVVSIVPAIAGGNHAYRK